MKLHVFNPEHDIALARNDKYFTAPRAGRQLREDCGYMPALWADEDDYVLVNDVNRAKLKLQSKLDFLSDERRNTAKNVSFVTFNDISRLSDDIQVEPWGWDSAICWQLNRNGLSSKALPTSDQLDTIRELSNRKFSSSVLKYLRSEFNSCGIKAVGESQYVTDVNDLKSIIKTQGKSVLKEPWSSSGRGIRYVDDVLDTPTENWVRNIIAKQGGIMIEPYYNKMCDFGMEFMADNDGAHYRGLSVFSTNNGFYTGNLIASEDEKLKTLAKYISKESLGTVHSVIEKALSNGLKNKYFGPLGVDMMIVKQNRDEGYFLHPMVEINMRKTMGHVAIDLFGRVNATCSHLRINYESNHYSLEITSQL